MKKKDYIFSNLLTILTTIISVTLIVFMILSLTKVLKWEIKTSYPLAFVLLALSILLNTFILIFERLKKIYISSVIRFLINIIIITYMVVFPIFGMFNNVILNIIVNSLFAFVLSSIGVSIFFNFSKSDKNIVKVKPLFVCIYSFNFSVTVFSIFYVVKGFIQYYAKVSLNINTFVSVMLIFFLASIIVNIIFYISLISTKRFINYCLIDYIK